METMLLALRTQYMPDICAISFGASKSLLYTKTHEIKCTCRALLLTRP